MLLGAWCADKTQNPPSHSFKMGGQERHDVEGGEAGGKFIHVIFAHEKRPSTSRIKLHKKLTSQLWIYQALGLMMTVPCRREEGGRSG